MLSVADLVKERFGELTPIQKLAMPRVLAGENVLILAPTGSGKTESVLLPVLEKIKLEQDSGAAQIGIRALYITPLRALSRDLKQRFEWWCDRLGVTHDIRTGDTTLHERARHRKDPPKILLTTVESLQALLMGSVMRKHLSTVRFVVVDEIHDILDNKRGAQLSLGLERLAEIARFQRLGLTATVANEREASGLLFGEREHAICESGRIRDMDISVEHVAHEKTLERMKELTEKNRSLIFVNTRSSAEELGATLKRMGAPVSVHHGSLSKEIRLTTEDAFKSGKVNSILCTSSLELGIDIGDVSLVMQYNSPHQAFRLVQRVGRAGHSLDKVPKGIIFATDFDDMLESEVLCALTRNGWLEDKQVERGALDVIAHQLVGLCLDFGPTQLSKAHAILSRSYAYGIDYEKLRKVALQLYSEGLLYYDEGQREVSIKATARAREYYSSFLSTIPKTRRFLMKDVVSNRIISTLDEEFVVNLEPGSSFLSQGMPWRIIDITETEVLAEPTSGTDIMVPSWAGEDIPVSFQVAQDVGKMRAMRKESPLPDDKTVVVEIVDDLIVVHACFGTRVNSSLSRMFARRLSELIGETVLAVADPYRITVKLPFPMKEEYIMRAFSQMKDARSELEESLASSSLLKFRFLHVGRMFGLLGEDANISSRFIDALRNSAVYEETVRSLFFRYFDVEKTQELLGRIKSGHMKVIVDKRAKPGFFAQIGLSRLSGGEAMGAFEPRERVLAAFRENALSKTVSLRCLSCGATRFMHLAGAPEQISCHKCNEKALSLTARDGTALGDPEFTAGLIRTYGKRALIALSTYGVGPQTADRILKKLHRDEETFYLGLIEAQKNFIKNKKYWKI